MTNFTDGTNGLSTGVIHKGYGTLNAMMSRNARVFSEEGICALKEQQITVDSKKFTPNRSPMAEEDRLRLSSIEHRRIEPRRMPEFADACMDSVQSLL